MLRLDPKFRRLICRSLFLLFGVAPLLGSVGYAAWQHYTVDAAWWEARLAAVCGLDVRLDQLSHPIPGTVKVQRVGLLDSETGDTFATATSASVNTSTGGVDIHFESVRLPAERMSTIWQLLHDRLLRQRRMLQRPLTLRADRATVVTPHGELELRQLHVEARRHEGGAEADITFNWAQHPADSPRIHVARRTQPTPLTQIRLETGAKPLPCSMFFAGCPAVTAWGTDLTFEGIAWIETDGRRYSGDIAGYLNGLNVGRVTADHFPYSTSGMAAVRLEKAIFQDNRWDVLQARLNVGPGKMDAALLQSMKENLDVRLPRSWDSEAAGQVDFDQMDFRFRMNADGLVFVGMCDFRSDGGNGQATALMLRDGRPIALQPRSQPQPCTNLVRAFNGDLEAYENESCGRLRSWLPRQQP